MQSERSFFGENEHLPLNETMKISMTWEHDECQVCSPNEKYVYFTATLVCTIPSIAKIKVWLDHKLNWDGLYNDETCATQCGNSNTAITKCLDGFRFYLDDEYSYDVEFTVPLHLFMPEIKKVIELRDQHQLDFEKSACSTCGDI